MILKWLNKYSLNFKLNVSILTCVSLSFLALIYFITEYAKPIIISQIDNSAFKSVTAYASDIDYLASDTEQILTNIKNTLVQTDELNKNSLRVVLNSAIKTISHSELNFTETWVYIFNPINVSKGTLYLSEKTDDDRTAFRFERVRNFYSRFPWFKEVPKIEKVYWSEPYTDEKTKATVVTCLVPFKFQDATDFNGLAALTIDLSSIQKNIYNFSFFESGRLLLVSRTGLYVTHPDPQISLKMTVFDLAKKMGSVELARAGNELLQGKTGHTMMHSSSVFQDSSISFYAPIKHMGWGLFLVYSQNEFLKPIRDFQFLIAGILLIVVGLLLFIINRICNSSTTQLLNLSKLAEEYGSGDFTKNFDETPSSADIDLLAKALTSMRSNLLNYTEKERKEAAEMQKRQSEIDIARAIQQASLSTKFPKHNAFSISTLMIPAKKIGGDFYDFFFINEEKFAIVIADVSGKGIPAALYMMKAQTLIRNMSKSDVDIASAFYKVNNELYEGNDTCMFVTAYMAVININNGVVECINAGHTPPIIFNDKNVSFMTPKKNLILGIKRNVDFVVETFKLKTNDHILLYTDGITEAENNKSEFYGSERLQKILRKNKKNPEENLNLVLKDIRKFVKEHPQSDDITMLDFIYLGGQDKKITLKAKNEHLYDMVEFLQKDMRRHKLSLKKQFNLIMATEEIFSNIASYAYHEKSNGTVRIRTFVKNNMYYVEFLDSGKRYNPLSHQDPNVKTKLKDRKIGGLGIYLAKKLSDDIRYDYYDGFNILVLGFIIE